MRIRLILRYPIQHAILLPDRPNENAPIWEDTVCRLALLDGDAPEGAPDMTYAQSLERAQREYLLHAPPAEQEIVRRHLSGIYPPNRILLRF